MSSTSRDIAGALNFRSGLIPYANDAAANQATEAELRRTIKFPPENAPGRAINTAMENGGVGKVLKQSSQASHYNTTTKDFPERGPKLNHDQFASAGARRLKFGDVRIEEKGNKFVVKGKEYSSYEDAKRAAQSERAEDQELAMDPPTSEAQRKAMWAAKSGHSTLGIPKSVGEEFAKADPGGKLPAKAKDGFNDKEEFNKAGTGNKIHEADPDARLKDKDNAINVLEKTDPWPSKKADEKAFGAAAHKTMGRWGGRASDKAGARDGFDGGPGSGQKGHTTLTESMSPAEKLTAANKFRNGSDKDKANMSPIARERGKEAAREVYPAWYKRTFGS